MDKNDRLTCFLFGMASITAPIIGDFCFMVAYAKGRMRYFYLGIFTDLLLLTSVVVPCVLFIHYTPPPKPYIPAVIETSCKYYTHSFISDHYYVFSINGSSYEISKDEWLGNYSSINICNGY